MRLWVVTLCPRYRFDSGVPPSATLSNPNRSPYVRHIVIRGQCQRAVETVQCHVILRGVEAAEAEVVPQLRVVHTHLEKSPVIANGHLGLYRVSDE